MDNLTINTCRCIHVKSAVTVIKIKAKPANFIDDIIEELKIAYNEDSKPWVVGFSGGKDSTALVQFI